MDGVDHDGDEVDLTGLMESIVDSDEEEDLAESIDVNGSFNFTPLCTRVFLSFVFLLPLNSLHACLFLSNRLFVLLSLTSRRRANPPPSTS